MSSYSFGCIGDNHHTDRSGGIAAGATKFFYSGYRDYDNALTQAKEFADLMTLKPEVRFIIQMGDANDVYGALPNEQGTNTEDREALNLVYLSEIWGANGLGAFGRPKYDVIGNWTFGGISNANNANGTGGEAKYYANKPSRGPIVSDNSGSPSFDRFYSFDISNDLHCIVLDDNNTGPDDWAYWLGGATWNVAMGSGFGQTQQDWLAIDLAANRGKMIVVFTHKAISPSGIFARDNINTYFAAANAEDIVAILQAEVDAGGDVVCSVACHHHPGAQQWWSSGDSEPDNSTLEDAAIDNEVDVKGITYISLRAPICMGGVGSSIDLATQAKAYSVITVGDMVKDGSRVRVEGLGVHPPQVDYNNSNYLVV